MLQSIKGIYKNGIIELAEKPISVEESHVIVTFLETKSEPKTDRMMYFGMFSGSNQSTEEDFQIAEFASDTDDNLDWCK